MIDSAYREMTELSKKKQDGTLNELKVCHINRLLIRAKALLGKDPSTEFLELLDEETLPQNSDAVLILGQAQAAMSLYWEKHHGRVAVENVYRWVTQENPGELA